MMHVAARFAAQHKSADGVGGVVLLMDSSPDTRERIAADLMEGCGVGVARPSHAEAMRVALQQREPEVAILNLRADALGELQHCAMLRALYPDLPIVVLASPGPAMRHVEAFRQETGAVDVTHAKPYVPQELTTLVGRLVRTRVLARDSVERTQTLQRLLPADALAAALDAQRVRLIDATVLFSDIRRSTELAARLSPCELFDVIGGSLAAQGAAVQASHGSVVKYTGDGLLAIFTGSGRSYLALRAARELQALDAGGAGPHGLRIGVGIAAGPIFSGLIGDPNHPRYDVLGASIHLAARLCAAAGPGEVVATRKVVAAARVPIPCNAVDLAIEARGFPEPVPSWRFTAPTDATHLAIVPDASSPSPSLHRA